MPQTKRSRPSALVVCAAQLAQTCAAIASLHRKHGDAADSREDYQKLEKRWALLAEMMSGRSRSQKDIEAKARVLLFPMVRDDDALVPVIAESLARDIVRRSKAPKRAAR